ncbi:hypothetical protein vBPaerPsIn_98c [Pseudomonas phage vB_Paer_PsIn]|uniref:Uncharacterized protein n=1 Tax=Pseudomonas phage vB_Paer_PsIn TaxID=2924907 RepID=A0AAE9KFC6_9CAUD|nr:hypothetical protein QE348_gp098 [Pseudomonas phage vB_Paer_PsIn]UOL48126.1 hypothetical protein vBPaerPsIn_98c [Pseudomonas phage vB_Paer_PsIn]
MRGNFSVEKSPSVKNCPVPKNLSSSQFYRL